MNESDIFVSCASFDKDDLSKKENNKKDYKNIDTIEEEEKKRRIKIRSKIII